MLLLPFLLSMAGCWLGESFIAGSGSWIFYAGPPASRPTSAKTLPPTAITNRRLKIA